VPEEAWPPGGKNGRCRERDAEKPSGRGRHRDTDVGIQNQEVPAMQFVFDLEQRNRVLG